MTLQSTESKVYYFTQMWLNFTITRFIFPIDYKNSVHQYHNYNNTVYFQSCLFSTDGVVHHTVELSKICFGHLIAMAIFLQICL
jgi:hypothetical protein